MKFKREWQTIYRDMYGLIFLTTALISTTLIIPFLRARYWDGFLFVFPLQLGFICVIILCYHTTGTLSNSIVFDEIGITFQQRKKPPKQIRWEEVTRIVRTKYGGTALVFWGASWECGDEIWFHTSKKIENYILSNHPELKDMFPDKKDYRKWQNWNKKLRW